MAHPLDAIALRFHGFPGQSYPDFTLARRRLSVTTVIISETIARRLTGRSVTDQALMGTAMSRPEATAILRVSRCKIYRLCEARRLPVGLELSKTPR